MAEPEEMNYLARLKCGCAVGAVADLPDNPKHVALVAKETGRWLKEGCTIERVTNEQVRNANWKGCAVCNPTPENTGQLNMFDTEGSARDVTES